MLTWCGSLVAVSQQVWSCADNTLCQILADKPTATGILVEVGCVQLCQVFECALELLLVSPLSLWIEHALWHLTDGCGDLQIAHTAQTNSSG